MITLAGFFSHPVKCLTKIKKKKKALVSCTEKYNNKLSTLNIKLLKNVISWFEHTKTLFVTLRVPVCQNCSVLLFKEKWFYCWFLYFHIVLICLKSKKKPNKTQILKLPPECRFIPEVGSSQSCGLLRIRKEWSHVSKNLAVT